MNAIEIKKGPGRGHTKYKIQFLMVGGILGSQRDDFHLEILLLDDQWDLEHRLCDWDLIWRICKTLRIQTCHEVIENYKKYETLIFKSVLNHKVGVQDHLFESKGGWLRMLKLRWNKIVNNSLQPTNEKVPYVYAVSHYPGSTMILD